MFTASPDVDQRNGRRDAAIATHSNSLCWRQLPGTDRDIVAVSLSAAHPRVQIISAYVPDTSHGQATRAEFFDRLDVALRRWSGEEPDALRILYLDANMWDPTLDPSRRASPDLHRLTGILHAFGLHVMNPPGQATHRSGTIIAWVATTHPSALQNLYVHGEHCTDSCLLHPACFPALGSDHKLITFDLHVQLPRARQPPDEPRLLHCDWRRAIAEGGAGIADLQADVTSVATEFRREVQQLAMDALVCKVCQFLWNAADMQGCVRSGQRGGRRRGCRWWTAECQRLWEHRQLCFRQFRRLRSESAREQYRAARNIFAHEVRRAQRAGWEEFIGSLESRSSRSQRLRARVVRLECSQSGQGPPPQMRHHGRIVEGRELHTAWTEHFSQVCPEQSPEWAAELEAVVAAWREQPGIPCRPVTLDELRTAAHGASANAHSAPGIDGLPYAPFLVAFPKWEVFLCSLFSLALRWGITPRLWTLGVVTPIPKEGDPMEFDNWRPITLLSCMGKLYEHVILRRICPAILPTIAPSQAGFRFGADEQAFALVESLRECTVRH